MTIEFKHAYSEPFRGSDLRCDDPSLAQQSMADDTDINVLLERFKITGQLPGNMVPPSYGDFTGLTDYRSAMDAVLRAQDEFMKLPAAIRQRFANDPQQFLEFAENPDNLPELRKMGLANEPPKEKAVKVEVVGGIGGAAPDVGASKAP